MQGHHSLAIQKSEGTGIPAPRPSLRSRYRVRVCPPVGTAMSPRRNGDLIARRARHGRVIVVLQARPYRVLATSQLNVRDVRGGEAGQRAVNVDVPVTLPRLRGRSHRCLMLLEPSDLDPDD